MKPNKQNADFLHIGERLLLWYRENFRWLPWRETKNPYHIWICEIILQQTQVKQGTQHYLNFIERFPNVETLADADTDEVLLYWKGLGYYSRAINLHKAAQQIVNEFNGSFPASYSEIIQLKGVGKYTAAAVASICFEEKIPAVDGNFYRVLSRLFADGYDVSQSASFAYFSSLALLVMPDHSPGDFNQAMMDLGSEICRPKAPLCHSCPVNNDCLAYQTGTVSNFPVKTKKTKVQNAELHYYFIESDGKFLIRRRGTGNIWKNLYEFSNFLPPSLSVAKTVSLSHKLTHRNLSISISTVKVESYTELRKLAAEYDFLIADEIRAQEKSFPVPLSNFLSRFFLKQNLSTSSQLQ